MLKKRVNALRKKMREEKIDVAVFISSEPIDDSNICYFTGFQQEKYHSFACFLVTMEKTTLILSLLDCNRATGKEADEIVIKDKSLVKMLAERIKKGRIVGVIGGLFPYKLSLHMRKTKDITRIVSELRSIKDRKELETIKKACRITNFGITYIMKNLKIGIREKELAIGLEREMVRRGASGMSFPTIVTSSRRSAYIHPFPSFSNQKIKRGLGLVDFGVIYNDYCSDVTVPFSIGKLTKKERKITETVKKSYSESLKKLRNGIEACLLYKTAENVIKKNGFELKHGLGHGIGLEVHDSPSISPNSKVRMKKNMVFTIEPGVYVPFVGGARLENDFLMKGNGFDVLTKSRFFKI